MSNATGIHARPASNFVTLAMKYTSDIKIAKVGNETNQKNAKSLLGVMSLCIKAGEEIVITGSGDDEMVAVDSLVALVLSGCGE